eukprot:jgi/Botrbrau1/17727/Bobra.0166s0148.1
MNSLSARRASGYTAGCSYATTTAIRPIPVRCWHVGDTQSLTKISKGGNLVGKCRHFSDCREVSYTRGARRGLVCASSQSYYEVLEVPQSSTTDEIKRAYKRKALKLHPDVNKAPDATQRFMECKVAFQTLSDPTTRAEYDRQQRYGGGASGMDFDFSNWEDFMGMKGAGAATRKKAEEAFYGLSDFFRDLEKDFEERRERRGGKPLSLWEELAEVGGEFLEFLEKELGLPPEDTEGRKANREAAEAKARQAAQQAAADSAKAASDAERVAGEARRVANEAKQSANTAVRSSSQDIDEMLSDLKKKLGL